jgi:CRP/FNR family transcriptional regulator
MTHAVAHDKSSSDTRTAEAQIRVLRDEFLFVAGTPRTHLYLIESGTVGVYRKPRGRPAELIEFAFVGDVVGLGALKSHVDSAQAVGEVRVKCLPFAVLDSVIKYDARAMRRYIDAVEREFQSRRAQSVGTSVGPVAQVAAFLVSVSSLNANEGRDPSVVSDSLECGTAATYLGIDVDALANALSELGRLGLIEPSPARGLRLLDLDELRRLAN